MPLRYRRVTYRHSPRGQTRVEHLWQSEVNRGFQLSFRTGSEWRPNADVYETDADLVVNVELAGMREEDIHVTLFADALLVSGRRECEHLHGVPQRFHEASIRYGSFQLDVALPSAVDGDRVAAQYDRGFLQVTLPKLPGSPEHGSARR